MKGWHFSAETFRDGSPLIHAGGITEQIEDIEMCERGWHQSTRAIDALRYAPGTFVARTELVGFTMSEFDKHVGRQRRTLLGYVDATETLREFARACALDVAHVWDCPDVVREYLETGREEIRDAARDAAWDAAGAAAWAAQSARLEAMLTDLMEAS